MSEPVTPLVLPPSLAKLETPAGFHHLGIKALFHGPAKAGKSFALASFPHPIFAIVCGEAGIEDYLRPELGDKSLKVSNPDQYIEAMEFALKHPFWASIVVDNINLVFADWMEAWETKLNVDQLEAKHWRKVKDPWKTIHRQAMLSKKNFGCSAWPKDIKYTQEEIPAKMPGAEPKMVVKPVEQDVAHVEKMIPFAVDMLFKVEIELDAKFRPTKIHRITYLGGRRPKSIPPSQLHAGKFWRFDSSKDDEETPFEKVLKPIMEKWAEGAVEYVAQDEVEAGREVGEATVLWEDTIVGRTLALFGDARSMADLKKLWDANQADINSLPKGKRDIVEAAKDKRKLELGGK